MIRERLFKLPACFLMVTAVTVVNGEYVEIDSFAKENVYW